MKKNKNKIIKLAKKKVAKIAKFFKGVVKKYKSKKNKQNLIKIIRVSMVFVFILLVASGFVFQNKIKKSTADYFVAKGIYYFNNGAYDTKKAERYFSWAVRLNPKADRAYYELGRIYLVENKLDLARQEVDKSLAINPENKRSFYIRGLIDAYDNKYDDAISDFQQFVAWAPTEWAGHNDLAWVYFLKKDFAKVKEASQDGLDKADDQNPWLLNGLGVAYVNLGEPQKAEEIFVRAKQISADITPERWSRAYPGNDPSQTEDNLKKFKTDMESNFQLAASGFTKGGTVFSACGSSCTPNCSCNSCSGTRCGDDGCGGDCYGNIGPDCSGSGNVCVGTTYPSPNGCGTCPGTKWPAYTAVCSYIDTGNVCDQDNCNKTIKIKTAYCTNIPNNGCGSPYLVGGSNCSNVCKDQSATCPPCSWKEVTP